MAKNVKLIIGSKRQNRIAPEVAAWVEKHAATADINLEVVDLKELDLPPFDAPIPPAYAPTSTDDGKKWAEIVSSADGFIFVTSEYNRSIPSSLKSAIDYLADEWKEKDAVIVSYGYVDGGQSAARHLNDILGWFKMNIIEPTVPLQLSQDDFTDEGRFKDIDASFAESTNTLLEAVSKLV